MLLPTADPHLADPHVRLKHYYLPLFTRCWLVPTCDVITRR